MSEALDQRVACKTMVGLLWLAHSNACEADLALVLERSLDARQLPDLTALQTRFDVAANKVPGIIVVLPNASAYDQLLTGGMAQ